MHGNWESFKEEIILERVRVGKSLRERSSVEKRRELLEGDSRKWQERQVSGREQSG